VYQTMINQSIAPGRSMKRKPAPRNMLMIP
jgi:hypothetical protein